MASYRLDERSQGGSRHTKHERPIVLRVQITVREYEEAAITGWGQLVAHDHVEEVLSAELLSLGV